MQNAIGITVQHRPIFHWLLGDPRRRQEEEREGNFSAIKSEASKKPNGMRKSNLLAYFTPSKRLSIELITCHNNKQRKLSMRQPHPLNIQKKKMWGEVECRTI